MKINVAYLLLYAANVDNNISPEEKRLIVKHLNDANQWQELVQQFEQMNEKKKGVRFINWGLCKKFFHSKEEEFGISHTS